MNPCGLTSSGAAFRPGLADNAASPLLPDGTVILAYNPKTGDASVLRITNAGPYSGDRKLDVSRAAGSRPSITHSSQPRRPSTLVVTVNDRLATPAWPRMAAENGFVPMPRLAVSPSLARELVMLRSAPQPVSREVRLVQGPRIVSRADFMAQRSVAP